MILIMDILPCCFYSRGDPVSYYDGRPGRCALVRGILEGRLFEQDRIRSGGHAIRENSQRSNGTFVAALLLLASSALCH